jgi:subtilisin family serine protease
MPSVRAISDIEPKWKVSPRLAKQFDATAQVEADVTIVTFEDAVTDLGLPTTKVSKSMHEGRFHRDAVERLASREVIKWIEPKVEITPFLSESAQLVGAPAIWSTGMTGAHVTVGVVDSGIDANHAHFNNTDESPKVTIIPATDWWDGGYPEDACGHGTAIAGVISGWSAPYGKPLVGIAPNSTLVIGRIFGPKASAPGICQKLPYVDEYTVIDDVVSKGAKVVNCSWGGNSGGTYDGYARLVDEYALDHPDVLLVLAAGNAPEYPYVTTPALAKNVLAVGSLRDGSGSGWTPTVDASDAALTDFVSETNNLLPPVGGQVKPDTNAPGREITAPVPPGLSAMGPVDYDLLSGSSFAAPHVSGIAALYKQLHPNASANKVKAALVHASFLLDDNRARGGLQGFGRLDGYDALYKTAEEIQEHFGGKGSARIRIRPSRSS